MSGGMKAKDQTRELLKRVSELERETAKLRADIVALRQSARRIGHDFNNVLQAVIGDAERIAETGLDRARELAETVLASASKGVDLTRELLSVGHEGENAHLRAAAASTPSQGGDPPTPSRPTASARILVVEDQEPIRDFTRSVLAKAGHRVTVVDNGADAIIAVRDTDFDLVLMDIHMPVMNGLTATRKIRALDGPRSKVPIVAVSGNVPLEHVRSLIGAGMNDHIAKPFKAAVLFQKIGIWLNRPNNPPTASPSPQKAGEATINEAYELMGRPWVVQGLTRLRSQIDEAFGVEPRVAGRDGRLADQAHALVSLAALLGFASLSELCSTLEDACRSGRDVAMAFEKAKAAASNAREIASGLIASH